MMKQIILTIAMILLFAISANAQIKLITVQQSEANGGAVSYYQNIDDALTNALSGAFITIPGGQFLAAGGQDVVVIDKELHIYGIGHYPAYTITDGGPTKCLNRLWIGPDAGNTTITGIEFPKDVTVYPANVIFTRCIFKYDPNGAGMRLHNNAINFKCIECVFDEVSVSGRLNDNSGSVNYAIFEKCIIRGRFDYFDYAIFDHNIFTLKPYASYSYNFEYSNNCLIRNSIFSFFNSDPNMVLGQGNIFQNNIFAGNYSFPAGIYLNNTGLDNIFNEDMTNIFNGYSSDFNTFSYSNDYHIKSGYSNRFHTTDGTEIGIFGTAYPYKEGAVPVIPHFTNSSIGPLNNLNQLLINITVEAQTK
jgi:hypothetical protein